MKIGREFRFEASHRLGDHPEYGKCRSLHGHSYRLVIVVEGKVNEQFGKNVV